MVIHREIGSSYHHKPMSRGVDYSPLMVESKEEAFVKEERRPEAILAAVPPPIFAGSDLYFGVSLSASASLRKRLGGYFYSRF